MQLAGKVTLNTCGRNDNQKGKSGEGTRGTSETIFQKRGKRYAFRGTRTEREEKRRFRDERKNHRQHTRRGG